jgi:multidrug efflux pump subunit AcrA (membrane-fusion protein)
MKLLTDRATFEPSYHAFFKTQLGLRPPHVTRQLTGLIVLIVLLLGAGLYWIPWLQTASGMGQLIALDPTSRVQAVSAAVSGRIKAWHVQDGSRVRKGDPLVEIVDNDPLFIERLESELTATRSRLDAARMAMETAKLDVDRKQRLFEKGLSARRDLEAATIRFKELKATAAGVAADVAKAEVQRARQTTQLVVAPRDGVILRIAAGDTATFVKEGDELVSFAPDTGVRAVEFFVSGLDAALVQPSRQVRLMFEGWPAVQFSGWPSVAIGTFPGTVRFIDPAISANGRFRVVVVEDPLTPWPSDAFLRLGGKARGWVILNEVRLGYEVWRNLNNFPPEPTSGTSDGPA